MNPALIDYILHLADTNLILAQRNSEWCGHGPVLEQDIAVTNIALDLLGQARYFYQYAAQLKADGSTEDSLSCLRPEREFKNLLLVEQPNRDWAQTVLRQFLYSQFQYLLYEHLEKSRDTQLAAIAAKSIKETTYHLRWSSEWVIRLGDGTNESRWRMLQAVDELWKYTGELFEIAAYEQVVAGDGSAADITLLRKPWLEKVTAVFKEATLPVPAFTDEGKWIGSGKVGRHTEHLGYILTELQFMQRAYPGASW